MSNVPKCLLNCGHKHTMWKDEIKVLPKKEMGHSFRNGLKRKVGYSFLNWESMFFIYRLNYRLYILQTINFHMTHPQFRTQDKYYILLVVTWSKLKSNYEL